MLIVDAHLDLAWNALQWNRDLKLSAHTIRVLEKGVPGKGRTLGTVALPELRRGRVALSFATLLSRSTGVPVPHIDFSSVAQSYAIAQGQLAYYQQLAREGELRIITSLDALDTHITEWEVWDRRHETLTDQTPTLGIVISMESADSIPQPDQLTDWYAAGVRMIGPAHYGPGRYAGGTGSERGLTDLGIALLDEMERLGILLDMTHLSDQAFWQAIERFSGPILASHNNCRALVPHQRQFSDDQLRAILERDGVIGVALDTWMLKPGWVAGVSTNEDLFLAQVVDHIDHICQVAGNCHHVAIGSDLDGGFGLEQSPIDMDTIVDLQRFSRLLAERGYSESDISAVMHGNWLRFLRESWG